MSLEALLIIDGKFPLVDFVDVYIVSVPEFFKSIITCVELLIIITNPA